MRKITAGIFSIVFFFSVNAYGIQSTLFDIRNEIFEESRKIKPVVADSKDAVLMGAMRDTCLMTTTQLDAYFSMLGIFNTIDDENLSDESIIYLIDWLTRIRDTSRLSLQSLKGIPDDKIADSVTTIFIERLNGLLAKLEMKSKEELNKLSLLKRSLRIR
jgi:hypothetical protein